MSKVLNKITINVPHEKVWSVLSDLEEVAKYNHRINSARYISGNKKGVGAARQCELKPKGQVKERVTKVEEGKALEMELYESDFPLVFMKWRTEVRPDGESAVVSQVLEYKVKFGVLGKLIDMLMMHRKLQKTMDEVFVSMKRYIETGETV